MTSLEYIRKLHKEIDRFDDVEIIDFIEMAESEMKFECYNNPIKAKALYSLHLLREIKDLECNNGNVDVQNISSEKVDFVSTTYFKAEPINGTTPLNIYHKMFLLLPKCSIVFSGLYSKPSEKCDNARYETDIERGDFTKFGKKYNGRW